MHLYLLISLLRTTSSQQTGTIQELDFNQSNISEVNGTENSPFCALVNYYSFGSLLYSYLLGSVAFDKLMSLNGSNGDFTAYGGYYPEWNTSIDQTILGSAADFSAIIAAFKAEGLEIDATTQNKSFTTLIEEFSLNVSLSLMSNSAFK